MKHILHALFLSVTVALTATQNIPHNDAYQTDTLGRSAETCGDPTDALPFYRAIVPQSSVPMRYFYSSNLTVTNTGIKGGWNLQAVACLVFITQEESTVPFIRLDGADGEFIYTANTTELENALLNGFTIPAVDPETFVYPTQICGSVPFYHLRNAATKVNFYTASTAEMQVFNANGYSTIGIAGYVLPVGCTECE
ncbi:hypothetical protein MSAN_00293700 [Mycena sanguinolenta]|uniref:DUF5648 domain-containing protein n=1 Tax=Mycena sanguinolenta TaxID=230812 RepID=A0A8H7DG28_9AGAR|nr:hypothetical protein MSAN_00293700 [Mycena sanguinolenta]